MFALYILSFFVFQRSVALILRSVTRSSKIHISSCNPQTEEDDTQHRPPSNIRSFFATTTLGFETTLMKEIKDRITGVTNVQKSSGGVSFDVLGGRTEAGDTAAFESLLWLRTPLKLMEKVIEAPRGSINSPKYLHEFVSSFDWSSIISTSNTIKCDVIVGQEVSQSLTHSHYSALTVKNAIVDQFRSKFNGARPDVNTEDPHFLLHCYLHRGGAIIYKVWSGEQSMHKRGYRGASIHKAALRETTAAGLLLLSGWNYQNKNILCDPMCGSGTYLIEAALIAANTAPGLIRYGAFESLRGSNRHHPPPVSVSYWPGANTKLYNDVYEHAVALDKRVELQKQQHRFLFGSDIHPAAIQLAKVASENSGTSKLIDFSCSDIADYRPKYRPRHIITNPPWDVRLEGGCEGWRKLGEFVSKIREEGGKSEEDVELWALSGSPDVIRFLNLRPKDQIKIKSAGVEQRMINF